MSATQAKGLPVSAPPGLALIRTDPVEKADLTILYRAAQNRHLPRSPKTRVTLPTGRTCDDWNVAVRGMALRLADARRRIKAGEVGFPSAEKGVPTTWADVEKACLTDLYALFWAWEARGRA